jgi:hypothetical protein
MQRLSLLSGTLANRPTPEVVNATWGGVGFGLLYFSTDTGQVFQWNGAAWADISPSFSGPLKISDLVTHTFVNPAVSQSGSSIIIPANTLQVNSLVTVEARCKLTGFAAGGNPFINLVINGLNFGVSVGGNGTWIGHLTFGVQAAAVQRGVGYALTPASAVIVPIPYDDITAISGPFAISSSLTLAGAATGTYVFDYLAVTVFR